MEFINKIINQASKDIKTIVLPEAEDIRVLKATEKINQKKFAKIVLLGNEEDINKLANENDINLQGAIIIDPKKTEKLEKYAQSLFQLRQNKGMTLETARNLLSENTRYFATMMLKMDDVDGLVSGACHSTADTLRPILQIIKGKPGIKTVSAFFIMCMQDKEFGDDGVMIFSDCGMNSNPNSEELSEIAIASADSYKELVNPQGEAKIAMLSYSTKGSAHSELVEKVVKATKLAQNNRPDLLIDGEMQLDAAIIPEVASEKAPDSKVAGKANVLVFPDLNAGNIGYKLTQRFGHAVAYGPMCQGVAKPANDLSRGCSADDIVGVVAITCVQAQNM